MRRTHTPEPQHSPIPEGSEEAASPDEVARSATPDSGEVTSSPPLQGGRVTPILEPHAEEPTPDVDADSTEAETVPVVSSLQADRSPSGTCRIQHTLTCCSTYDVYTAWRWDPLS